MKSLTLFLGLFFSINLSAETIQLSPLWEEDSHFQHYRCLMMEGAVGRLESIIQPLEDEIRVKIESEIQVLKLNLGYPVTLDR